eukprot:m.439860 g.439860  ORF g.439860 m.439860 type:complete len:70 (-) comp18428_c0_seq1:901-1110(-)
MSMSFAGRAAQMAMVTFIGVTSGVYIFTPIVDNMKAQVEAGERAAEASRQAGQARGTTHRWQDVERREE